MDNEDSFADPTNLGFVAVNVYKPANDDRAGCTEGFLQKSWWMPLWSFDLETVGVAAHGSSAIYSVMAMLKIGPVLDIRGKLENF